MSTSQVDLECAYNILSLQTNSLSNNQSSFSDGDDFFSLDDDFEESGFFALDDDQERSDKQSSLLNDNILQDSDSQDSDDQDSDDQDSDDQDSDDQDSDNQSSLPNDQASADVQSSLSNDSSLTIEGFNSEISFINLSQSEASTENQEPNPKRRKISHPLWHHFEQSSDGKYVYCNLCRSRYGKKTGISTIKRHFEKHHKGEYKQHQSKLSFGQIEHYGVRDERKVKRLNGLLLRWIICDQQAFSVVDDKDFRTLILVLDPRFKLPTRQTISNHITSV